MTHCSVPCCNSNWRQKDSDTSASRTDISFHQFPSDKDIRRKWIIAIRRDEGPCFEVTNRTYVCSLHFKDEDFKWTQSGMKKLKRGVIPSMFAWTKEEPKRKPPTARTFTVESPPVSSEPGPLEGTEDMEVATADHDYFGSSLSDKQKLEQATSYICTLEAKLEELQIERFGISRISGSPESMRFYTGFTSHAMFVAFYNAIYPHAVQMITWSKKQRYDAAKSRSMVDFSYNQKLTLIDQLFMFLHKIRLGSLNQELADKFNIHVSTVSRNTISWANFLYCVLGSQPLWPTRSQIKENLPESFRALSPSTRVILDCTELKVQSPSSLVLNSEIYSHYKGTTTFKGLVGIAPSGLVTFVSTLYAGSISDISITATSGILKLLEPGDDVMVDKGFKIGTLLESIGCTINMPHFLEKDSQFTKEQVKDNQHVANLRVHVERAIRRFKEFHIFDSALPLTLAGTVQQIWSVCCLLTNFQGPLINEK